MTAAPRYVPPKGKRAIYYHTTWANYGRNYQVKDLPIDYISDIAYAFYNLDPNGKIFSGDAWADTDNPYIGKGVEPQNTWESPKTHLGNLGQFNKLRQQGKKFNFCLSVGGWTWSANFSEAVSTPARRQNMVDCIKQLFTAWPGLFNGISLDWEYLSNDGKNYGNEGNKANPADADNFIELLKLLRSTFGPSYYLSFCVSASPEKIKMPVDRIHPLLDEIHIMTYDFHDGAWGEKVSGHHTNLKKSPYGIYSVEEAVACWSGYGVPSEKLFIGAALYSRGFANTDGIGKPCSGGSPDQSWEKGSVDYKALPLPGAKEMWDDQAHAAYSYDPVKRILNSYDDVRSVTEKCQYIHEKKLGGMLIWESSGDRPFNEERSIMRAIAQHLTHGTDLPKPTPTPTTATPTTPTTTTPTANPPAPVPSPAPIPPASGAEWAVGKSYKTNDSVVHKSINYKCLQGHTSQSGWAPDVTRALWQPI